MKFFHLTCLMIVILSYPMEAQNEHLVEAEYYQNNDLFALSLARLKNLNPNALVRAEKVEKSNIQTKFTAVVDQKEVCSWEGTPDAAFLLDGDHFYYAEYDQFADSPIVIRRVNIKSKKNDILLTLPSLLSKNKHYRQKIWIDIREGKKSLEIYRYSSVMGVVRSEVGF